MWPFNKKEKKVREVVAPVVEKQKMKIYGEKIIVPCPEGFQYTVRVYFPLDGGSYTHKERTGVVADQNEVKIIAEKVYKQLMEVVV